MIRRAITSLLIMLCPILLMAQMKPHLQALPRAAQPYRLEEIKPIKPLQALAPAAAPNFLNAARGSYTTSTPLDRPVPKGSLFMIPDADTGLPIFIKGSVAAIGAEKDLLRQAIAYLETVKAYMQIERPAEEFSVVNVETDDLGQTHLRAQQRYRGVKVYGGEIMLHAENGCVHLLNGRYYPTPRVADVTPSVVQERAVQIAVQHVQKITPFHPLGEDLQHLIPGRQIEAELVIYHPDRNIEAERLAWAITLHPNLLHRWAYFIDAKSGQILHHFSELCRGHYHRHAETLALLPPRTATARDLFGINRTFGTWLEGNTHYLIDASRPMFNNQRSRFPNSPVGVIWTIDGRNNSPLRDNFDADHVRSADNTWNNPVAVSAHYNAGRAYEYFLQTFNRNSINGQGGNIISVINITEEDGSAMDNAFWNGAAMFYGNGNRAFIAPLARALDVAGHEMSHGVIQNTANLEYQNESGALNESFADIFAAMIDRDDWQIGEDVVSRQFFPSGALRDLSNPNNGGTSINDVNRGWQPKQVSEQYRGREDNGGVHINSGIPNRAFFLFATTVGRDRAERVFYRALTTYLVRSSVFTDLRLAVIQSATDLHGANSPEVMAAANAFNTVGIVGSQGSNPQTDLSANPGEQFIIYANSNLTNLNIVRPNGATVAVPVTTIAPASKPSVTDDGSIIVYVTRAKRIQALLLDWNRGTVNAVEVSDQPIWRNVAISKDGLKLAALTDDLDNQIFVFDLRTGRGNAYTLLNPTFVEGVFTDNVAFADALEWDASGEFVMYDALSVIRNARDSIEYWDIGFLRAWDNAANRFGDGFIEKLFTGLPENVNIGNPTFAKNAPYVIAFDYADFFEEEYYILGVNIQTRKVGGIYENSDLSFPNYSVDDRRIIFDGFAGFTGSRVIGVVDLATDRINARTDPPNATVLVSGGSGGARWGAWFANGRRVLTDNQEVNLFDQSLQIFPNPFAEILYLRGAVAQDALVQIEVLDPLGRVLQRQNKWVNAGDWQESVVLRNIPAGAYVLRVSSGGSVAARKVMKWND